MSTVVRGGPVHHFVIQSELANELICGSDLPMHTLLDHLQSGLVTVHATHDHASRSDVAYFIWLQEKCLMRYSAAIAKSHGLSYSIPVHNFGITHSALQRGQACKDSARVWAWLMLSLIKMVDESSLDLAIPQVQPKQSWLPAHVSSEFFIWPQVLSASWSTDHHRTTPELQGNCTNCHTEHLINQSADSMPCSQSMLLTDVTHTLTAQGSNERSWFLW